MTVSAHEKFLQGQSLCDLLRFRLEDILGRLPRNEAKKVCSLGDIPKFAWVYHYRGRIRVYLRCRISDESRLRALVPKGSSFILSSRGKLDTAWAKLTPYLVDLKAVAEIEEAIPLLVYAAQVVGITPLSTEVQTQVAGDNFFEGAKVIAQVTRLERDPAARLHCLKLFGSICQVCGFDFGETYGEIGIGFIHVHHLTPLATIERQYRVDPARDLRPVCANCHEMLHKRTPPFSIEELKEMVVIRIPKGNRSGAQNGKGAKKPQVHSTRA